MSATSTTAALPSRLPISHTPTPLWHDARLDALVGCEVWVKRDDMTGGAEAGNKIRKLEFLLAEALASNATTVVTCGAAQSNHARATALVARHFGLDSALLLRSASPETEPDTGNLRLMRMCGAQIEFISPKQYTRRNELMMQTAARLRAVGQSPYVIPEGGSNGLGALGYVHMVHELREQQRLGLCPEDFDTIICACGSGGTAAGTALGVGNVGGAQRVDAIAVCDDAAHFRGVTAAITAEARALVPALHEAAPLIIHDAYKGPAYGVMDDGQRAFLTEVARRSGLVLDPTYSGKALFGLMKMSGSSKRALFVHTGGLPGLLA